MPIQQVTQTKIVSDLTGAEERTETEPQAVKISRNGGKPVTWYLTTAEATALDAALAGEPGKLWRLLSGAQGKPGAKRSQASGGSSGSSDGTTKLPDGRTVPSTEFKDWARANGHKVSERGRNPAETLAAYVAAHPAA